MGRAKAAKGARTRKRGKTNSAAYNAAYYAKNKKAIRAKQAAYYAKHKKEISAQQAAHYAENKKTVQARQAIYNAKNNQAIRTRKADYYVKNKKAILAIRVTHYTENKKKILARNKDYSLRNKATLMKRRNATRRIRFQTDDVFRTEWRLRRRLHTALREASARKAGPSFELIGCSAADCVSHLKAQLGPSQKLADYVTDHIFPVAAYDLTKPEQQRRAFHFSNLQPLSAEDNMSKGDRAPTRAMASKVERWAWPPGVQPKDLGARLGRKLGPGAVR